MYMTRITSGIGAALALSILAGCSSTGSERATAAATSMKSIREQLASTSASLDETVGALSTMIEKPAADLTAQYEAFNASLAKLTSNAKSVQKAADEMKAKGDAYFAGWSTEISEISNPELQAKSSERRDLLAKQYEAVTASYESAKTAFTPLLASLEDVQSVLALDMTSEGLRMAKPHAEKAKSDADDVREEITAASDAINDLAATLSGGASAGGES